MLTRRYLGGKKSRQVDFGHHLVSSVFTFTFLVRLHLELIQIKELPHWHLSGTKGEGLSDILKVRKP